MIEKLATRTGIAISALAMTAAPAFAANVTAGNSTTGSKSYNSVGVSLHSSNSVSQSNEAHITNDITVKNNTGGNKANNNTGNGDVRSGAATTDVSISNTGNVNTAPDLCGCGEDTTVEAGNDHTGYRSKNLVDVKLSKKNSLKQTNKSWIDNVLDLVNNTGRNRASGNTGDGTIGTGGSDTSVDVLNDVNYNQ